MKTDKDDRLEPVSQWFEAEKLAHERVVELAHLEGEPNWIPTRR